MVTLLWNGPLFAHSMNARFTIQSCSCCGGLLRSPVRRKIKGQDETLTFKEQWLLAVNKVIINHFFLKIIFSTSSWYPTVIMPSWWIEKRTVIGETFAILQQLQCGFLPQRSFHLGITFTLTTPRQIETQDFCLFASQPSQSKHPLHEHHILSRCLVIASMVLSRQTHGSSRTLQCKWASRLEISNCLILVQHCNIPAPGLRKTSYS